MLTIPRDDFPFSYKYLLKNKSGMVTIENSDNRVLSLSPTTKKPSSMVIAADGSFRVCTPHLFILNICLSISRPNVNEIVPVRSAMMSNSFPVCYIGRLIVETYFLLQSAN